MNVKIEKKTVREVDGIRLGVPLELWEIELKAGNGVWYEVFGSELEVRRFMRGVEAGYAMSGNYTLKYEIP